MHGKFERGMAGPDFVAVLQVSGEGLGAIDVDAIVAAHIDDPAFGRIHFHHEMDAREIFVFAAEPKMRVPGATHEERVGAVEVKEFAFVRSGNDRQRDSHV
jgi:hypothetical protein